MVSAPSLFSRRYLWYQMPQLINNSDCVIYKNADIQYVNEYQSQVEKARILLLCVRIRSDGENRREKRGTSFSARCRLILTHCSPLVNSELRKRNLPVVLGTAIDTPLLNIPFYFFGDIRHPSFEISDND